MSKEEFNYMEIVDQVNYINSLLSEGNSLTNISKDFGMSRVTF